MEAKSQTEQYGHSLRVVNGSIHKKDLPKIIPNNATLTNRCTVMKKTKLGRSDITQRISISHNTDYLTNNDGGKIVVGKNHIRRFASNVRAF